MKFKSIQTVLLVMASTILVCGCASEIKDDATRTPIGSVITGETTSPDSYVRRIKQENQNLEKDAWRPETNDKF